MSSTVWPISWPESVKTDTIAPTILWMAERYAVSAMRMLTLGQVGGEPITVTPGTHATPNGLPAGAPADLHLVAGSRGDRVWLDVPVGRIDEVSIGGIPLDASEYRLEGGWLVRVDGSAWPARSASFTVTYLNAYPVDHLGSYAAGIMAEEFLKAITGDKRCRLPSTVTNVSRQGVTMQIESGMFPNGVTGIMEIDAYLYQWNPNGLKTRPTVWSPDLVSAPVVGRGGW